MIQIIRIRIIRIISTRLHICILNMRKLLQAMLKVLAKLILQKYRPEIIAITGSVGKTSAKEAIHAVLMNSVRSPMLEAKRSQMVTTPASNGVNKFGVQRSIKNYNNELGVPLAIIGAEAGGKNILKWLAVFWRAKKLILFRDEHYPKVLILELAADKPGDMDYLLDFVRPRVGVLTRVGPVHLEKFGTQEKILQEKSKLIKSLPKTGFAVLNYDYKDILSLCDATKAKCITYGFDEGADVRAKNILYGRGQATFALEYGGKIVPIVLLHAVGKPQIYAILAGVCCGIVMGMNLDEIKESLKNYQPPRGRGNLLKGIKNTFIIDETYNSSPQAVEAALENLIRLSPPHLDKGGIRGGRSIAVLGDMLELGPISKDAHMETGKKVQELCVDYLFTVGFRGKDIADGAKKAGMSKDKIFSFGDNLSLGKFLQEKLEPEDVVLVKGSRGMHMEEIIDEIKSL